MTLWTTSIILMLDFQFSSAQFSHSVMSDSLQPHGLQHAWPPRPSPTPGVFSNSCPLSQWCHPTISSSVVPFSSRLQSFPASGPFQMSQFFASGGQSIEVSASASVLPMLDFSLYKVISYLLSSFSKRGNWGLRLNAQSWDQKWWSQDNYPCLLIAKLIEKRRWIAHPTPSQWWSGISSLTLLSSGLRMMPFQVKNCGILYPNAIRKMCLSQKTSGSASAFA